jgi:pseudouridine-5'-phosphate glycosidase/pseudouridine kinase
VLQKAVQLAPYITTQFIKLGEDGVVAVAYAGETGVLGDGAVEWKGVAGARIAVRWFPPAERMPEEEVLGVNGAGDTFLGVLVAGLSRGATVERAVGMAQRAACLTLRSPEAVAEGVGGVFGS